MELLRKNTPSWVIFIIDMLISACSLTLAYLLRFNFDIPYYELQAFLYFAPVVLFVRAISYLISKLYSGIIRHASTHDAERIFVVIFSGSLIFVIINLISYFFINSTFPIPFSIIILDFLITIFALTFSRLLVRSLYLEYRSNNKQRTNVVIVGSDNFALTTKRTLDSDNEMLYNVVAFIDTDIIRQGKRLEGVYIQAPDKLESIFEKHNVSTLVFTTKRISASVRNQITEICLNTGIKVLTVPEVSRWINGELSPNQIRRVRIEDLLGRDPIRLDEEKIRKQIVNKTVMVTGAAGSIGREIVTQLTRFNPKNIILYDQAESALHDLELDLQEVYYFHNYKAILGDITNAERLEYIIKRYQPSIIYHAAAYKHVPMMEKNPAEAALTNVRGTKTLAEIALKYEVDRFVMVSTDKAVNPTNVMGASKRIAEIFIQSMNGRAKTKFITTRFGNVLGSTGSVIPRFRAQIENGGPVTVTHPEVTRYFMTIPEACQLVLEAGSMGEGGEIFIFDMGQAIKILDLAKKMIKLYGLTLGKDIQIIYTGLRPGEKIYEELLNDKENTLPTYHPQIMIAKVREYDHEQVCISINQLLDSVVKYDNYEIVRIMKEIVPEFISQNSVYEVLDDKNTDK